MRRLRQPCIIIRARSARVCFSDKTELQQASGNGTIYTYSVMRRAPIPYAIAYVTLAEGADDDDQHRRLRPRQASSIGQAVKLVFKPSEGGPPVPMFTPLIFDSIARRDSRLGEVICSGER